VGKEISNILPEQGNILADARKQIVGARVLEWYVHGMSGGFARW
jgi:hypothetical protein